MGNVKRDRIEWIDFAKCVTMLLVIFAHTLNEVYPGLNRLFRAAIFSFHMPLFFILSAATFRCSQSTAQFAEKTKRAFRHLILPAFVLFLLRLLVDLLNFPAGISLAVYLRDTARMLFWASGAEVTIGRWTAPAWGMMWFLVALFLGRSLFDYLHLRLKRPVFIAVLLALTVFGVFLGQVQWLPLSLDVALAALPFLWLGTLLQRVDGPSAWLRRRPVVSFLIAFGVWIATYYPTLRLTGYSHLELATRSYPLFPLCFLTAAAGSAAVFAFSILASRTKSGSLVSLVGRYSMELLCVHAMDYVFIQLWAQTESNLINGVLRCVLDLILLAILLGIKRAIARRKKRTEQRSLFQIPLRSQGALHAGEKVFVKKTVFLSLALVCGVLLILFAINGYAPFGKSSLAGSDARVQYIDFFLYLKDVLTGKNALRYSFSKMLGGSPVALFSYYLASPFNLLILFFQKAQILTFYDLLVFLKVLLAAGGFALFLSVRLPSSAVVCGDRRLLYALLSAGYGLSQYMIAQSCNVIWLDGVYMLPLILLGVWLLQEGRPLWVLAVPVALSVLFNWYTAGMNCLFSAVWFLLEYALRWAAEEEVWESRFSQDLLRYLTAMILGLLCSAVLFAPTVYALSGSAKGDLELQTLQNYAVRGNLLSVIESYAYGSLSSRSNLSLFCGTLPLTVLVAFFFGPDRRKQKLVLLVGLLFVLLMFFWTPLYSLFNLLERPNSFECRFSYLQIFALLFFAAFTLSDGAHITWKTVLPAAGLLMALLFLAYRFRPYEEELRVLLTLCGFALVAGAFSLFQAFSSGAAHRFAALFLLVTVCTELGLSAHLLLLHSTPYAKADNSTNTYIQAQQQGVDALRAFDTGTYRVSQTSNRWTDPHRWTANYDEPMAYGYWSLSEYSSTVSDRQVRFLNRAGYRAEAGAMNIVNTSLLGLDSLLGVKYVLSDIPINGLEHVEGSDPVNGKTLYENPFALPLMFRTAGAVGEELPETDNPFEYQNCLFQALTGTDRELYIPLPHVSIVDASDGIKAQQRQYQIVVPEGDYAVYGNLPWRSTSSAQPYLDLNGTDSTVYAWWLSPSAFYIPCDPDSRTLSVTVYGEIAFIEEDAQFYALDLSLLRQTAEEIRAREAAVFTVENGQITADLSSSGGESLFLSVPYDRGWRLRLNGTEIRDPALFADTFYLVPLQEGENHLEMAYHVPKAKEGLVMTVVGIAGLIGLGLLEKKIFIPRKKEGGEP